MRRVLPLAVLALAALPLVAPPLAAQQGYQGVPGSPVFNVGTFGALCDGATNFTAQIQAATSAVPASGGVLYFPRSAGVAATGSRGAAVFLFASVLAARHDRKSRPFGLS